MQLTNARETWVQGSVIIRWEFPEAGGIKLLKRMMEQILEARGPSHYRVWLQVDQERNCNFSLMGLKSTKNGLAQWFFQGHLGRFDILMSQKVQVKTIPAFQGCAKIVCFPSWHGSGVFGSVCLSLLVSVKTWVFLGTNQFVLVIKCAQGSANAVSGQAGNTPFWHNPGRREFFHLDLLGHQNIKTSLHFHSKNHWGKPFFAIFSSVREKLQFTVSLNHPVVGGS